MKRKVICRGSDHNGDNYILAYLPAKDEFATWFVGQDGQGNEALYYGHYCQTKAQAIKDFKERICLDEPTSTIIAGSLEQTKDGQCEYIATIG
ncbi:hypothetical protein JCM16358_22800 [Halanaerocella petrolearia]